MMQKWLGAFVAVALASTAACKKDLHTSSVAAVLPAGVSSQLSKELLAFVEVLPADVASFGYFELGTSFDKVLPVSAEMKGMVDDLVEMGKRRWGVDLREVRGFGAAMQTDELVLFAELGDDAKISTGDPEVTAARLGKLTVLGKSAAVNALLASAKKGPALHQGRPEWVRHALGRAAGQAAFYTLVSDKAQFESGGEAMRNFAATDDLTLTLGERGIVLAATTKAGKLGEVRGTVEAALAMGRGLMENGIASMPDTGAEAVIKVLARHYGAALIAGVAVAANGDELTISLPWRAPSLPQTSAAPSLTERVIAQDEWAVVQFDAGAPMLQSMIGFTDVLGAPLDRAKLHGEVLAAVSTSHDVPAIDPRAATISVGSSSVLVSLHGERPALIKGVFPIAGGKAVAISTTWGVAGTIAEMSGSLSGAISKPQPSLPLAVSSKLVADEKAILRAVVDFDRLPMLARAFLSDVPVRTVELLMTATSVSAEVIVKKGEMGKVQALLAMAKNHPLTTPNEAAYRERQKAGALDELGTIFQYHNAREVQKLITPKVDGDRLTFRYKYTPPELHASSLVGFVGLTALAAVPAFQKYQDAARNAP